MSNTEQAPDKIQCAARPGNAAVEIITSREVPLGGPRAMPVRRTLPQRKRSLIGAWCFVDHYGPDDVSVTGGMDVAPHPHTGLQTVSWLFEGEISHHDSGDHHGTVRPGELNLMTSGAGIAHSEVSTSETTTLHGVQLWLALPDSARSTAPRNFEHYAPPLREVEGGQVLVFLGELAGEHSPVETFSPLVGAELRIAPGQTMALGVNPEFEHGLLVDAGEVELEGVAVQRAELAYTGLGAEVLHVHNNGQDAARCLLIGGEPFGEEILMWWNFVGRTDDEIREFRQQWQDRTERFGQVPEYVGHGGPGRNSEGMSWLPAPTLPNATIRARRNPDPVARPENGDGS